MPDGTQVGRYASGVLLTVPNVITFGRLCAVPLAFWLVIDHRPAFAFFLFVAAGVSDAVDGWLARRCERTARLAGDAGGVPRPGDRRGRDRADRAGPGRRDTAALRIQDQHRAADFAGGADPVARRFRAAGTHCHDGVDL